MPIHVTTTDISLLGFEETLFKIPASTSWEDFLQPIIDKAERVVAARVTDEQKTALSGTITFDQIGGAISNLVASRLFDIMETASMNRTNNNTEGSRFDAPSEIIKSRNRHREECDKFLIDLTAIPLFDDIGFSGGSSSVVETGHFDGVTP